MNILLRAIRSAQSSEGWWSRIVMNCGSDERSYHRADTETRYHCGIPKRESGPLSKLKGPTQHGRDWRGQRYSILNCRTKRRDSDELNEFDLVRGLDNFGYRSCHMPA